MTRQERLSGLYGRPCRVVSIEGAEDVDHERRVIATWVKVRAVVEEGYAMTFESEIGLAEDNEAHREGEGRGGSDG